MEVKVDQPAGLPNAATEFVDSSAGTFEDLEPMKHLKVALARLLRGAIVF